MPKGSQLIVAVWLCSVGKGSLLYPDKDGIEHHGGFQKEPQTLYAHTPRKHHRQALTTVNLPFGSSISRRCLLVSWSVPCFPTGSVP